VVPLALGLPLVALIFSLANAALLAWRIRVENRALTWAVGEGPRPGAIPFATLAKG
jgi:methyltransferase